MSTLAELPVEVAEKELYAGGTWCSSTTPANISSGWEEKAGELKRELAALRERSRADVSQLEGMNEALAQQVENLKGKLTKTNEEREEQQKLLEDVQKELGQLVLENTRLRAEMKEKSEKSAAPPGLGGGSPSGQQQRPRRLEFSSSPGSTATAELKSHSFSSPPFGSMMTSSSFSSFPGEERAGHAPETLEKNSDEVFVSLHPEQEQPPTKEALREAMMELERMERLLQEERSKRQAAEQELTKASEEKTFYRSSWTRDVSELEAMNRLLIAQTEGLKQKLQGYTTAGSVVGPPLCSPPGGGLDSRHCSSGIVDHVSPIMEEHSPSRIFTTAAEVGTFAAQPRGPAGGGGSGENSRESSIATTSYGAPTSPQQEPLGEPEQTDEELERLST